MKRKVFFEDVGDTPSKSKTLADLKRPASRAQIKFAQDIASLLDLKCPNFEDFNATSQFISQYRDAFYEEKNARESAERIGWYDDEDDDDDDLPF